MDPNLRVALIKGMIPTETLRQLDDEELRDRLAKALELLAKSDTADSPALRKAFGQMAQDVLAAQPRTVTEQQVTQQLYKAARAADPREAAAARARAAQIQASNPVAPRRSQAPKSVTPAASRHLGPAAPTTEVFDKSGRRLGRVPATAIRKAKTDPLMVCFDADGKIIGLADPADIKPTANQSAQPKTTAAPAPKAAPAAQPGSDVAKSRRAVPTVNRYGGRR